MAVAAGITAFSLPLAACSRDRKVSTPERVPAASSTLPLSTEPRGAVDIFPNTELGTCLLRAFAGPDSIQAALRNDSPSHVGLGLDYYRYTQDSRGEWGTERLRDPWVADCQLKDGTEAKVLVTAQPQSRDGILIRRTGVAAVLVDNKGVIGMKEPPGTDGGIIYRDQNVLSSVKSGYAGENLPFRIVGNESDPKSLSFAVVPAEGMGPRSVMTREFFPGKKPAEVMPR